MAPQAEGNPNAKRDWLHAFSGGVQQISHRSPSRGRHAAAEGESVCHALLLLKASETRQATATIEVRVLGVHGNGAH